MMSSCWSGSVTSSRVRWKRSLLASRNPPRAATIRVPPTTLARRRRWERLRGFERVVRRFFERALLLRDRERADRTDVLGLTHRPPCAVGRSADSPSYPTPQGSH